MNAIDRYEENIREIENSNFDNMVIRNIDYDLKKLITSNIDINS